MADITDLSGLRALVKVGAHQGEWSTIVRYNPTFGQYLAEFEDGSRDWFQRNEIDTESDIDLKPKPGET